MGIHTRGPQRLLGHMSFPRPAFFGAPIRYFSVVLLPGRAGQSGVSCGRFKTRNMAGSTCGRSRSKRLSNHPLAYRAHAKHARGTMERPASRSAQDCRDQARRLRGLAEKARSPALQRDYRELAYEWDMMAEEIEMRRGNRVVRAAQR
jgi:hypothetical protein